MNKRKLFQNFLFYLLAGLLIFIPLYPKFPFLNVTGTYVAIRLEDFFIAVVINLWFLYILVYERELFKNFYFQVFLLFWFTGIVSLLSAMFITDSIVAHLGFLHWARRVELMVIFWIAATCITSKQQIKFLLWVFILVTSIVVFYGFGQLFLGFKVISTVDKDFSTGILSTLSSEGRVNSTFAGHYDLSIYLSYFLIVMSGLFFNVNKIWRKTGIILIGVLCIILLGYAASRISFLATIVGMLLVLFLLKKRAMIVGLIIFSIIVSMIVPQLRERILATINVSILKKVEKSYVPQNEKIIGGAPDEEIAKQKAKQGLPRDISAGESTDYTELEVGRSISIRLTDEWPRAIHAWYKNPLLGTGYSSISLATDNDYLRSLGETGIVGFVALMFIFFVLLRDFVHRLSANDFLTKLLFVISIAIVFDVAITALFIDVLEASKAASLFWLLAGTAWSQSKYNKLNRKIL